MLSLFGQYCPRLKSLSYPCNSAEDLDFYRMYGHKLEELVLSGPNDKKQCLELCPNLKNVWFPKNSVLFTDTLDQEFLPKLEYFGKLTPIYFQDINEVKILSDKYSKTLKALHIRLSRSTAEELKTCIECIARFENLKELIFCINAKDIKEPIDKNFLLIGQKCTKLLKLDLTINSINPISNRFFDKFSEFKAIKKLKMIISDKK